MSDDNMMMLTEIAKLVRNLKIPESDIQNCPDDNTYHTLTGWNQAIDKALWEIFKYGAGRK